MKKYTVIILAFVMALSLMVAPQAKAEEGFQLSSKLPVTLYGFFAVQAAWTDSQLGSYGNNLTLAAPNRVIDETTVTADDAAIGFSLQSTRIGLYFEPYEFAGKDYKIDARLELDFFNAATVSYALEQPRIRRAYVSIGTDTLNFLFGQEWDLFSPLNPITINTSASMWNQGNLGFRRPQVRATYKYAYDVSGVEAAVSVNSPNSSMLFNDLANTTGIPMLQGRLGFWRDGDYGKYLAYVSGMFSRHNNAVAGADDVNNWGTAVSFDLPFHTYFRVLAEGHFGYSLNTLLSISAATTKQRTFGGWGMINSAWTDMIETNIGFSAELLKDADVAAGNLEKNMVGIANIRIKPVKHLMFGLEYNYMRSNYQGNGNSIAHMGMTNVMYTF